MNTIQELVKEGTFVHKGDVLVTLDSSNIQKNYDQSLLDLQAAEAALSAAKEAKEIQEATTSPTSRRPSWGWRWRSWT